MNILVFTMFQLLLWQSYTNSMTEQGFILQGWIGTAMPVVIAGWLYMVGRFQGRVAERERQA